MRSLVSLVAPIAGTLFLARFSSAAVVPQLERRNDWGVPGEGGCWTDNIDGQRALDKSLGEADDMTPTKCQDLCLDQGFTLAGVEFGRECFCGNTIFGNNRPSTTGFCNTPCSGDSSQTCGGADAISLYVQNDYTTITTGPASVVNSYNGYAKPRCFHDNPSKRILPDYPPPGTTTDQMTVQKCIDGCAAAGYSSAGLEFGRECYCGHSNNPLADSAPISECSQPCSGDASEYCGGDNRLLLYHDLTNDTPPSTPQGHWVDAEGGCWGDSPQDRALQHFMGSFEDLTPGICQSICEESGFYLAGTENARECYCGNTIMGNNRPQDGICVYKCGGSTDAIPCGGLDAINIYVRDNYQYTIGPASLLPTYDPYSSTGCWVDDPLNRILKQFPAFETSYDEMTVEKCIMGCSDAGYDSAGLEYGGECRCDNVMLSPEQGAPMEECNMACNGDGSQICGGSNRILIYQSNKA